MIYIITFIHLNAIYGHKWNIDKVSRTQTALLHWLLNPRAVLMLDLYLYPDRDLFIHIYKDQDSNLLLLFTM